MTGLEVTFHLLIFSGLSSLGFIKAIPPKLLSFECCQTFFMKLIVAILLPRSFWIGWKHSILSITQSYCSACS